MMAAISGGLARDWRTCESGLGMALAVTRSPRMETTVEANILKL
jgi:hypothetical protein